MSQMYIVSTAGLRIIYVPLFRERQTSHVIRMRKAVLSLGLQNAAFCSWHFSTRKM